MDLLHGKKQTHEKMRRKMEELEEEKAKKRKAKEGRGGRCRKDGWKEEVMG